jgi:SAM-dependent MidA family methyltransferase
LYHPEGGFYGAGGGAGRTRDFLTSPEVGPLFGAVLARALDAWWVGMAEPDPFVVVDAGAGAGSLAKAVLDAAPACSPALRYLLVETSEALRAQQAALLPLELPAFVLGPALATEEDGPILAPGSGPIAASLAELPAAPITGVVVANELLDNMPFLLLERGRADWGEVRVDRQGDAFTEVVVRAPPDLAQEADRLAPDASVGSRIPVQRRAQSWLRSALSLVERGHVVVIDYGDTTAGLAGRPWSEWVRTYRAGGPGGPPLDDPGTQDITCEVAVDQLARIAAPDDDATQGAFLRAHGIDDLVSEARARWHERAAIGDLAALAARSRVNEADVLTDPAGLGAFRVLQWQRPLTR